MTSGGGNLHCTLDILLTLDIGKVGILHIAFVYLPLRHGLNRVLATKMCDKLRHIFDRIYRHTLGVRCLLGIIRRHEQVLYPLPRRGKRHGQGAVNRPQLTVERKLAEEGAVGLWLLYRARRGKNTEHYRQVVNRTCFFRVRRCEIDRHPADREFESVAFYRGSNPLTGLLDGSIRQSDNIEIKQSVGNKALDSDGIAAYALYSEGMYRC